MYTDEVKLDMDNVFLLLYAAKKYIFTRLAALCREWTEANTKPDNVCFVLEYSLYLDEKGLSGKAMECIEENINQIMRTTDFLTLSHNSLVQIVKNDRLSVLEKDFVPFVFNWAEVECGRNQCKPDGEEMRKALGDILFDLRFPVMMAEDFVPFARRTPNRILNNDEIIFVMNDDSDKDGTNAIFRADERAGTLKVPFKIAGSYIKVPGCYVPCTMRINFMSKTKIAGVIVQIYELLRKSASGSKTTVSLFLEEGTSSPPSRCEISGSEIRFVLQSITYFDKGDSLYVQFNRDQPGTNPHNWRTYICHYINIINENLTDPDTTVHEMHVLSY